MRKYVSLILFLSIVIFNSCKKSTDDSSNPPGSGGGGGSTELKVTAFTPEHPYLNEELTITGTGFSTDKNLNTVNFNGHAGTIVSATATQIKVKMPDEGMMGMTVCHCASLDVIVGGKTVKVTGGIYFKRDCQLFGINDPENNNYQIGRPADSLVISGAGFNQNSIFIIDGKTLQNVKVDSNFNCAAKLRLPKSFFGGNNDENAMEPKLVKIINGDGKTSEKSLNFLLSPKMHISGMAAEFNSYSNAALAISGGIIKINISGRNLKADAIVKIDGSSGIHTSSLLPAVGYPDVLALEISPATLINGNYQVSIWRDSILYGICNFILNP